MTNSRWQVILGNTPSKSNCYKIIAKLHPVSKKPYASLAKSEALTLYENKFFMQCDKYRDRMIKGYFMLHVKVFYPSERSDLDNALKIILDCLQHKCKAIKNDNRCTKIIAEKFLDKERPRIEFMIEEM